MITIETANAYFDYHLDKSYWSALTDDVKTALLAMSERQVAAELEISEIDTEADYQVYAACEQAVYLNRNYANQTAGKVVISQSLDGVGSQSFKLINEGNMSISPTAMIYIKQAKIALRPARSITVYRG